MLRFGTLLIVCSLGTAVNIIANRTSVPQGAGWLRLHPQEAKWSWSFRPSDAFAGMVTAARSGLDQVARVGSDIWRAMKGQNTEAEEQEACIFEKNDIDLLKKQRGSVSKFATFGWIMDVAQELGLAVVEAAGGGAAAELSMLVFEVADLAASVLGFVSEGTDGIVSYKFRKQGRDDLANNADTMTAEHKQAAMLKVAKNTCYLKHRAMSILMSFVSVALDVAAFACNIVPGMGAVAALAWRLALFPFKYFYDKWAQSKLDACLKKASEETTQTERTILDLKTQSQEEIKPQQAILEITKTQVGQLGVPVKMKVAEQEATEIVNKNIPQEEKQTLLLAEDGFGSQVSFVVTKDSLTDDPMNNDPMVKAIEDTDKTVQIGERQIDQENYKTHLQQMDQLIKGGEWDYTKAKAIVRKMVEQELQTQQKFDEKMKIKEAEIEEFRNIIRQRIACKKAFWKKKKPDRACGI